MGQEAGKFNRRITIQKRTENMSQFGQLEDKWVDVYPNIWAYVLSKPGTSVAKSQPAEGVARAVATYSFRVRYRKGIDAAMRIVYRGKYFEITEVIEDIRNHEYVDIAATFGGSAG